MAYSDSLRNYKRQRPPKDPSAQPIHLSDELQKIEDTLAVVSQTVKDTDWSAAGITIDSTTGDIVTPGSFTGVNGSFSGTMSISGVLTVNNAGHFHLGTNENIQILDHSGTAQIRAVNDAVSVHTPLDIDGSVINFNSFSGGALNFYGTASFSGILTAGATGLSSLGVSGTSTFTGLASFSNGIAVTGNVEGSTCTFGPVAVDGFQTFNVSTDAAGGIEIHGNTPFADWHVGNNANDYDVRWFTSGGVAGTDGKGDVQIQCGTLLTSGALGYLGSLGAGGAVTQGTSTTTAVTLNTLTGQITCFGSTGTPVISASNLASFTVNNSKVAAKDVILVVPQSGLTTNLTEVSVTAVAAGSFQITVYNRNAGVAQNGGIVINFVVIKGATT